MQTDLSIGDTQSTGVRRWVVVGLLLLATAGTVLMLVLSSHHGRLSAQVVSYSAFADGRGLSLLVRHGTPGCDDDVQVAVNETADRITLFASVRSLAQVCDAAAHITPFDVTLQSPLGERAVFDGAHDNAPVPSS